MSWLLLDAGNSALKWTLLPAAAAQWPGAIACSPLPGAADGAGSAQHPGRYAGTIAIDAPDLAAALGRACALAQPLVGATAPAAVFGCAVAAPERVAAITAALQVAGAGPVQWLPAAQRFAHEGIVLRNAYSDATRLGADRWHALIGARARYPDTALALVNAGTATTVDGLRADGTFCGGVIAPGLALMRSSLALGTARLPLAAGQYVAHPDNTDDAIHTGILDAQLGLVERRIRRIHELAGSPPQVIVAGGNGATLAALLRHQDGIGTVAHEADLVLQGLWHQARAASAPARPL